MSAINHDSAAEDFGPLLQTANLRKNSKSLSKGEFIDQIKADVAARPHLPALRDFNHSSLRILSAQLGQDLSHSRVLDVGASVHGFALECAIELGYKQYIGIDLGVTRVWDAPLVEVSDQASRHLLCQMDAHRLWLQDESVDAVLCISGFEHYLYPEMALQEIMRVLRKGGFALITYEPIWTCSYGHHLHHFGLGFEQVPPWAHLILNKTQMSALLAEKPWPSTCPISRAAAVEWIYDGRDINRRDHNFHERTLKDLVCGEVRWLVPHADADPTAIAAADYAASLLPYTREQLLTRGFSMCFQK
jgi:SAM-dependent methyltransferase